MCSSDLPLPILQGIMIFSTAEDVSKRDQVKLVFKGYAYLFVLIVECEQDTLIEIIDVPAFFTEVQLSFLHLLESLVFKVCKDLLEVRHRLLLFLPTDGEGVEIEQGEQDKESQKDIFQQVHESLLKDNSKRGYGL